MWLEEQRKHLAHERPQKQPDNGRCVCLRRIYTGGQLQHTSLKAHTLKRSTLALLPDKQELLEKYAKAMMGTSEENVDHIHALSEVFFSLQKFFQARQTRSENILKKAFTAKGASLRARGSLMKSIKTRIELIGACFNPSSLFLSSPSWQRASPKPCVLLLVESC